MTSSTPSFMDRKSQSVPFAITAALLAHASIEMKWRGHDGRPIVKTAIDIPVRCRAVRMLLMAIVVGIILVPYLAAQSIQTLSPTAAPVGGVLTITGAGFGINQGTSTVKINGALVNVVSSWSATQIVSEIPVGATSGNVVVTVGGVSSNGVALAVVPAPSITSVSPNSGVIGTSITISGTNLLPSSGLALVSFYPTGSCSNCGVSAIPTNTSNTAYSVLVPPGAVSGKVSIQYDYVESNPLAFTVTGTLAPVADAGLNDVVPLATTVRLNGTNSYDLSGLALSYQWSFYSVPSGSNAVLLNPATPFPTFVADVAGEYVVQLVVNNGSQASVPKFVYIDTQGQGYVHPSANAGPDQTVSVGTTVQLDGSGSTNPAGSTLNTYFWCLWYAPNDTSAQVYKGITSLSNPTAINPTFVASSAGSYYAILWLHGMGGCDTEIGSTGSGTIPAADFTKISTVNSQPSANAGPNQSLQYAQTIQLDGTGSTDIDGNPLTYSWTIVSKPAGSTAALTNPNTPQPSFYADVVGTYVVQLIVNDGIGNSLPGLSLDPVSRASTVTITSSDVAPVANAGPPQTVVVNSFVDLDGTGSTDAEGHNVTYSWSLISAPTGSAAILSLANTANPYFLADLQGNYVAQLIVNDGIVDSAPATVEISTTNSRPIANAGPNLIVVTGQTVHLNGAASINPDADSLTYNWALLYQPSGANATLNSKCLVAPSFVASVAGLYVVQLTVNNGLQSPPVTIWVKAEPQNQAPIVNAGSNQTITLPTNTLTLNGTASDDGLPYGTLTITWSVVSGPGSVTFFNPNEATTQASFSAAGTYLLKLTANDTQLQSSSTTSVTVNPAPYPPPTVSAGSNQAITLPANVVSLNGSATDNGLPLTTLWSVVSGPGLVAFGNVGNPVTTAMFTIAGVYDLRLTATNGETSASADATITVNSQAGTPASGSIVLSPASAGPNTTGSAQQLQATVTNNLGAPITNQSVTFTVTGPNGTTGSATTNASGIATFSYTGGTKGIDSIVATATVGVLLLTSNTSMISWASPSPGLSGSTVQAQFFVSPQGAGTFDITPATITAISRTSNIVTITVNQALSNFNVGALVSIAKVADSTDFPNSSQNVANVLSDGNGSTSFTVNWAGANASSSGGILSVPAFVQTFGAINFNPPSGSVPGMPSSIGVTTVPFTNVTTDANGNYTGSVIAQGNGVLAGIGSLSTFEAVFTGTFSVAGPGNVTFNFLNSDGFVFGIGNGAARVSGTYVDPPSSGNTAFLNYPVMGSFNTVTVPLQNSVTVNFPSAGTYSYEIDYADSNQVALIPAGSTWKYTTANPVMGGITSISRNSGGIVTVTINQALGNFAAGTPVTIAGVTDSTDFPNITLIAQNPISFVQGNGLTQPSTTFALNWTGAVASSSGGTATEQWNEPFYLVGFDDSGFALGQAPFTNSVGGISTPGCPPNREDFVSGLRKPRPAD